MSVVDFLLWTCAGGLVYVMVWAAALWTYDSWCARRSRFPRRR